MHPDEISQNTSTCNILSIYLEYGSDDKVTHFRNSLASIGVAVIDSLTCKNKVCEFYSKFNDPSLCAKIK